MENNWELQRIYPKTINADEAKIREDAEKRMKEEEEMKKAQEEKGNIKQQIFEEAKKKEEEMKRKEAEMKPQAVVTDTKQKGTGSAWNANSYFWEEKNYNKWSKDKIQEYIGKFKHTVPGGSLEVTDCDIEGEASISIRKGKKICSFDFEITLKWAVTLGSGDEKTKVTGTFKLPEVSTAVYDDEEDLQINIEYKTGLENREKINDTIRGEIVTALRKNVEKYVTEFKNIDLSK